MCLCHVMSDTGHVFDQNYHCLLVIVKSNLYARSLLLCFCIWIIIYYCPFVLDLVHQSTNGWNLARLIIGVFYRSYEFPFFFGYQKFSKFPVFNIRIPCRNKWEDLLYECLPWRSHPQPLLQQEQWLTYYRVCLCYWELQFFEMQIYKDWVRAFCGCTFKFFLSVCKMYVTYILISICS
jgi:hypothetical protein